MTGHLSEDCSGDRRWRARGPGKPGRAKEDKHLSDADVRMKGRHWKELKGQEEPSGGAEEQGRNPVDEEKESTEQSLGLRPRTRTAGDTGL